MGGLIIKYGLTGLTVYMNIVLMGYRGTGKSTIGKFLVRNLRRKLFCIDDLIVENVGMSIPDMVQAWGWSRFREIEHKIVEQVATDQEEAIIDCGGGVVLDDRNVFNLKQNGRVVLLIAEFQTIVKRIRRDPNRPALIDGLTFEEEQRKVIEERREKYLAAADLVCDTTSVRPKETVKEILEYFKQRNWV